MSRLAFYAEISKRGDVVLGSLPQFQSSHCQDTSGTGHPSRSAANRSASDHGRDDQQSDVQGRAPSRVSVLLTTVEGQQSGLLADSVVMTDNVVTVIEAALDRVIGSLPMTEVDNALRHTLGL